MIEEPVLQAYEDALVELEYQLHRRSQDAKLSSATRAMFRAAREQTAVLKQRYWECRHGGTMSNCDNTNDGCSDEIEQATAQTNDAAHSVSRVMGRPTGLQALEETQVTLYEGRRLLSSCGCGAVTMRVM